MVQRRYQAVGASWSSCGHANVVILVCSDTLPTSLPTGKAPGRTSWKCGAVPYFGIILQMLAAFCCDIVGLLQESKRPLPKKLRKKSEKGFRGLSAPGSKKTRKRVENGNFSSFFRVFGPFSTFFRLFFELLRPQGGEALGTPFRTFFGVF